MARELDCALLLDEFYSHYLWTRAPASRCPMESAARYVEDVDRDPVVIFDGLTKNWRYPGWRVTWTVGPRAVIEAVASAGSFLDGGGSKPLQRAAIPLLEDAHVVAETQRDPATPSATSATCCSPACARLGIAHRPRRPRARSTSGATSAALPPPLNDGMGFFRAALEQKVIAVPGEFFDVNPGKRRASAPRASATTCASRSARRWTSRNRARPPGDAAREGLTTRPRCSGTASC